jgi:hypothetical protein
MLDNGNKKTAAKPQVLNSFAPLKRMPKSNDGHPFDSKNLCQKKATQLGSL